MLIENSKYISEYENIDTLDFKTGSSLPMVRLQTREPSQNT